MVDWCGLVSASSHNTCHGWTSWSNMLYTGVILYFVSPFHYLTKHILLVLLFILRNWFLLNTTICSNDVMLYNYGVYIQYFVPLDMKGCICHLTKWQIHSFISKGTTYLAYSMVRYSKYGLVSYHGYGDGSKWLFIIMILYKYYMRYTHDHIYHK